jgi:hypothetical protein
MAAPTKKKQAPKWLHALSVLVLLGGSTALCWMVIKVLTWAIVGTFEGNWHDWVLYDICIFIVWCVCFATVGELMIDWLEHKGWTS